MLSVHPEDQLAVRCLKAGAAGYLAKNSAPEELLKALCQILSGGRYVSAALTEKLILDLQVGSAGHPHDCLSDREYEVMRLIVSGWPLTQIADVLSLSVKTVSTYRTRLMAKLQIETNADLVRYAVEHGLVQLKPLALPAEIRHRGLCRRSGRPSGCPKAGRRRTGAALCALL